jgi:hypothetical protein
MSAWTLTVRLVVVVCVLSAAVGALACSDNEGSAGIRPAASAAVETTHSQTPSPAPTATPVPPTPTPTPIPVAELPIIDLHFHPDPAWGDLLARTFDQLGVRAAGNSAASGSDRVALAEAERHPGRILPFIGAEQVRQLILRFGSRVWNLEVEEARRYVGDVETSLRGGQFRAIGEVHVNNWNSNIPGSPQFRWPADSPLMQRLMQLATAYDVPLSIHMDAELESVAQMERLLEANRGSTLLWAHTGHYAEPSLLRRLLETHPNLYCELSYRTAISAGRRATTMDEDGRLRPAWRDLLEAYPERFVIGTDLGFASPSSYAAHIATWRNILLQVSPETAQKIAFENAERLLSGTLD